MLRKLGASLFVLAGLAPIGAACTGPRTGELEPRYVAVHNTLAALGLAQIGPIQQGSLAEGRDVRLRLDLGAQCTTIVAIGGPGVRDLDVSLLDAEDKPVAHDTTKEPQATLRTCPTTAGRYTLLVKMTAGAGDFMAATWAGGTSAPGASPAAPATALAGMGTGTCESPFALTTGATTGNTRRGEAENAGSCANTESKELVYKLEVTRRQRVTVEIDPQFDSVLYIRKEECADAESEIACNDDATAGAGKRGPSARGSRLDEVLEPGNYFFFVDGYAAESGTFHMDVQIADVPTLAEACRQIPTFTGAKIAGALTGQFDHAHASCGADAKGPDAIHRFDLGARARVRITEHSADFTPAVHLRKVCADEHSELGCGDSGVKADEATWTGLLDPGSYVLFADSADKDARGRYTLESELASEVGAGVRGDACGDATNLSLNDKGIEGDTFNARDDIAGKCGGQGSPDVVYRFELSRRSRVLAQFPTQESEHVFVLTRSCADRSSEVACGPFLDQMLQPGVYFLGVDGKTADSFGRFTFNFIAKDVSAQENACHAPPTLVAGQTVTGTTLGAGDKFTTSCAGREDGQASPDRVYKIVLTQRERVKITLTTPTWDGVLAIRKACMDPQGAMPVRANEWACNNDFGDSRHAKIEQTLDSGTYFVVVDGHQGHNEGVYTLEFQKFK